MPGKTFKMVQVTLGAFLIFLVVSWIRSAFGVDHVYIHFHQGARMRAVHFYDVHGQFGLAISEVEPLAESPAELAANPSVLQFALPADQEGIKWEYRSESPFYVYTVSSLHTFGFSWNSTIGRDRYFSVLWAMTVPVWFLIGMIIVLMFGISIYRSRIRLKSGLCEKCGYDLRASKERCPECGTAVYSAKAAHSDNSAR